MHFLIIGSKTNIFECRVIFKIERNEMEFAKQFV